MITPTDVAPSTLIFDRVDGKVIASESKTKVPAIDRFGGCCFAI